MQDEPLWVDLRWARSAGEEWRQDSRFMQAVASVAAAVRGDDKAELIGEEARQHRRTVRLVRSAVGALIALTVLAAIGGVAALDQRNQANQQRDEARHQAKTAESRLLALQANQSQPDAWDRAMLLAIEAARTQENIDTRHALFRAARQNPRIHAKLASGALAMAVDPAHDHVVLGTQDGRIRVLNVSNGATVWTVESEGKRPVHALALAARSQLIAAADQGQTVVVRKIGARSTPLFLRFPVEVGALAINPQETVLAVGLREMLPSPAYVEFYDLRSGKRLGRMSPPEPSGDSYPNHSVTALAYDPSGRYLAIGAGFLTADLSVWDVRTRELAHHVLADERIPLVGLRGVSGIGFSPDGQLMAASFGQVIRVWEMPNGSPQTTIRVSTRGAKGVSFSPDGSALISGSPDRTVYTFDVGSKRRLFPPLTGSRQSVIADFYGSKARVVTASAEDVLAWDLDRHERVARPIQAHASAILSVGQAGRSGVVTGDRDGVVRRWDRDGKVIAAPLRTGEPVFGLSASRNGDLLAITGTNRVRVWDFTQKSYLVNLAPGIQPAAAISPDGRLLAMTLFDEGGIEVGVMLWDIASRKEVRRWISGPNLDRPTIVFAPDGNSLVIGDGNGQLIDWNLRTGGARSIENRLPDGVRSLAFSESGEILAAGSGQEEIELWEMPQWRPIEASFNGDSGGVAFLSFSADNRFLASSGGSGGFSVWDIATRRAMIEPFPMDSSLAGVIMLDERMLVSAHDDGTVRMWDFSVDRLIEIACRAANRNLTISEWNLYIGSDIPHHDTC
ncbi:WD40 repeat domain-containing protein [Kribbella sp. NPDC049174]|uniref:WD40 repeat domain-containing protein n=1 Tax=Kribbella sp. NPDC049174 TaxID=3364112 RepID=UPI00371AB994